MLSSPKSSMNFELYAAMTVLGICRLSKAGRKSPLKYMASSSIGICLGMYLETVNSRDDQETEARWGAKAPAGKHSRPLPKAVTPATASLATISHRRKLAPKENPLAASLWLFGSFAAHKCFFFHSAAKASRSPMGLRQKPLAYSAVNIQKQNQLHPEGSGFDCR
jgi:hypothetical protein